VPSFDQLVSASQRPDVPCDERIDANAEVFNQFIKGLEFPDREEVESYLPTLTKASYLEPFFEQYVIGNRRTPTHTAILYLNEYGIVDRGDGTSRYLEKLSIGGFRFLKDVVSNTDIIPDLRTSRHLEPKDLSPRRTPRPRRSELRIFHLVFLGDLRALGGLIL
jgi:hypothetical protein